MSSLKLLLMLTMITTGMEVLSAGVIKVPEDYSTIREGIKSAVNGDTVLVAPGIYYESFVLSGKAITLASWYLTTGSQEYVNQTIIDGKKARSVIRIKKSAEPGTSIIGLTVQNGEDGITPYARFNLINCRIIKCKDGIDYEKGSGGLCRDNIFEFNKDDGIDLDYDVDIIIEDNIIRHNDDDGIEIRLHDYKGPLLTYIIRRNIIRNNDEDGIQLIDYPGLTNREFYIYNNLIYDNAMVGIGCMGNGKTVEDYGGFGIPEPIYITNNTIAGNTYGITGGENLVAVNNLIEGHSEMALKNISGTSIISYSMLWDNSTDFENCNIDQSTVKNKNPLLDKDYRLSASSPCIDAGTPFFVWHADTVLNFSPHDYFGNAPDIGCFEFGHKNQIR